MAPARRPQSPCTAGPNLASQWSQLVQAIEKMVGNMMELNRPTPDRPHRQRAAAEDRQQHQHDHRAALKASALPGLMVRITAKPMKRPTMAPPQ
jgi:hypothetical protein